MHKLQYIESGTGGSPGAKGRDSGGIDRDPQWTGRNPGDRNAAKALVLLHGRGGSAEDILALADALPVKGYALFAPQATGHSWYPYSFLSPIPQNEPWFSSALDVVGQMVRQIEGRGIAAEDIFFTGFSQGACLMLEFLARNATRYGGVAAFTGGLIGDRLYPEHYQGDFKQTPIFMGTSDPDPHVPVQRVHDTTTQLMQMNALVTERVYPRMGHTITTEEIREASRAVFRP
ncbi:MAG TPA: dienelactone hydrolase family protein [Puia sp.]|nr:dienelactone hydrolase family protein [Puia sp.]